MKILEQFRVIKIMLFGRKKIKIEMHKLEDLVNDVINLTSGCDCYDTDDYHSAYKDAVKIDKWIDKFRIDKIYNN